MANDIAKPIRRRSFDTNRYVTEIDDIFLKYGETLDAERQVAIDQIDKWCSDWTAHINNHATQQKHLLNDAYIRQRRVFDEKHNENLETANAYYLTKQRDLFDELHDVCRSLKFQLATLKFSKYKVEHPEVIIVEEQMESKTPQETTINDREDARRRRRLNKKAENKVENNNGARVSSPPHSIASNTAQTSFSDQQSLTTKTKINNGPLTDNNDDSNNKCFICFMIFPISMTRNDRHQHINAHMEDD